MHFKDKIFLFARPFALNFLIPKVHFEQKNIDFFKILRKFHKKKNLKFWIYFANCKKKSELRENWKTKNQMKFKKKIYGIKNINEFVYNEKKIFGYLTIFFINIFISKYFFPNLKKKKIFPKFFSNFFPNFFFQFIFQKFFQTLVHFF